MTIDKIGLNNALNQLSRIDGALQKTGSGKAAGDVAGDLGALIENAVQKLDGSQKVADQGIADLVAGEPVDLHQVMLQMEQSLLNMNLALQVRNKIIEAYQEIQRMQV